MRIRILNPALAASLGVAMGDGIDIPSNRGVPLSREWRNRIRDAEIDKCVAVGPAKTPRKRSTTTPKQEA